MRTARARPSRWHLLEVLKPTVPVKRMVFHEITQAAIEHAIDDSRDVDYGLVDAQESRRIVDRLYGYPVSEVCWRKIRQGLSRRAGAVAQRPPRRRAGARAHGLRGRQLLGPRAPRSPPSPPSPPRSPPSTAHRVAGSRDFDSPGPDQARRRRRARRGGAPSGCKDGLDGRPFTVTRVETKPYTSRPKPPFITSTLQQVGGIAAAHEQPPGDVDRPGPLRGRLHHLHAHRQHHAVGHRRRAPPAR